MDLELDDGRLRIIGTVSAEELSALRDRILDLRTHDTLRTIDLSETRRPDVYLVQLVWRALVACSADQRRVALVSSSVLDDLLARSGLEPLVAEYRVSREK